MYLSEDSATASENSDIDAEYAPTTSAEPHFPTKQELDDLIRNLGLTKFGAELLTSRLNEWNLLSDDSKSTAYRKRQLEFSVNFDIIEYLCYCKDVEGLFHAVEIDHDPTQWRLSLTVLPKVLKQCYFTMAIYRVSTKSLDNLKNLLIVQLTSEMSEMFK